MGRGGSMKEQTSSSGSSRGAATPRTRSGSKSLADEVVRRLTSLGSKSRVHVDGISSGTTAPSFMQPDVSVSAPAMTSVAPAPRFSGSSALGPPPAAGPAATQNPKAGQEDGIEDGEDLIELYARAVLASLENFAGSEVLHFGPHVASSLLKGNINLSSTVSEIRVNIDPAATNLTTEVSSDTTTTPATAQLLQREALRARSILSRTYFHYLIRVTRPRAVPSLPPKDLDAFWADNVVHCGLCAFRMLFAVRLVAELCASSTGAPSASAANTIRMFAPRIALHPRDVPATEAYGTKPESVVTIHSAHFKPLLCILDQFCGDSSREVTRVRLTISDLLGLRVTKEGSVTRSPLPGRVDVGWRLVPNPTEFPFDRILALNREFEKACPETYEKLCFQLESYFEEANEAEQQGRESDLWALMKTGSFSPVRGNRDEREAEAIYEKFASDAGLRLAVTASAAKTLAAQEAAKAGAQALDNLMLQEGGTTSADEPRPSLLITPSTPLEAAARTSTAAPTASAPRVSLTKFIGVRTLPECLDRLCVVAKAETEKFGDGIELVFSPDTEDVALPFGSSGAPAAGGTRGVQACTAQPRANTAKISRRLHARAELSVIGRKLGAVCKLVSMDYTMQALLRSFEAEDSDHLGRKRWKKISAVLQQTDGLSRPVLDALAMIADPHFHHFPAVDTAGRAAGGLHAPDLLTVIAAAQNDAAARSSALSASKAPIYDERSGEVLDKKRHTANLLRLHPTEEKKNRNPLARDSALFLDVVFPRLDAVKGATSGSSRSSATATTSNLVMSGESGSTPAGLSKPVFRQRLCAALGIADLNTVNDAEGLDSFRTKQMVRQFCNQSAEFWEYWDLSSSTQREDYLGYHTPFRPEALLVSSSTLQDELSFAFWDQQSLLPRRCFQGRLCAQVWIALRYFPGGFGAWEEFLETSRVDLCSGFRTNFDDRSWCRVVLFQAILVVLELYEGDFGLSRGEMRDWLLDFLTEILAHLQTSCTRSS
ncbi:unnamed protein product [Amoebophrya sp. A120]|nr:unnamed protein product [Amoebophrya sp. A120]|eukprot:GSA120T00002156001.1